MKLAVVSDLHLNRWVDIDHTDEFLYDMLQASSKGAEVLIIPGDISHWDIQYKKAIIFLSRWFKEIYVVLGNHEFFVVPETEDFYRTSDFPEKGNSMERIRSLKEDLNNLSGVHLLDRFTGIHQIGDLKIAGDTMWYDTTNQEIFQWQQRCMGDSRFIFNVDFDNQSRKQMEFYDEVIDSVDIFVSHVPLMKVATHDVYGDLCFRVNVPLRKDKIYIFGHSHEQGIYHSQGAVGVINAIGYPWEKNVRTIKVIDTDHPGEFL